MSLWSALSSAEGQDTGFLGMGAEHLRWKLGFGGWELSFLRWKLGFWGWEPSSRVRPWWHNKQFVHSSPLISHGAAATLVPCGSHLRNCPRHLPSPLSPQGRARRTAHLVVLRLLHPTGAASPPAVRASTPPTATGCPTKSARGTLPARSQPDYKKKK